MRRNGKQTYPQSGSLSVSFLVNIREADCMPLMQKRTKKLTRRSEGYWHEKKWESDCGRGASFNRAWGAGLSRFFPWKASASALDACCFIMMRLWTKCSQAYLISSTHVLNKSFYSCHHWWMCSASKASWDRSKHRDLVLFLKDLHAKTRWRNKPSVQPLGARLPHMMLSFWCNIYR